MRTEHAADDLDRIAQELTEVLEALQRIAGRMREERMPALSLHANTATNKHLRALWDWSKKTEADADMQFRAFRQGKADRAEVTKRPKKPAGRKR